MKWKHFPRYWPFVRGIHQSPVNSPHKGRWCGALMLSLICAWIHGWVNNREACDLKHHHAHYDVIAMLFRNDRTPQDSFLFLKWIQHKKAKSVRIPKTTIRETGIPYHHGANLSTNTHYHTFRSIANDSQLERHLTTPAGTGSLN